MKLNGTDNIITDRDIIVTDKQLGNTLFDVYKNQQNDINNLKSGMKWLYRYGGVGNGGGGNGSGSGSSTWKANIYLNGQSYTTGSVASFETTGQYELKVVVSNPAAGGYRFKVYYAYDQNAERSYNQPLTIDNDYTAIIPLTLNMNSQLTVRVVDADNMDKAYTIKYYVQAYNCVITMHDTGTGDQITMEDVYYDEHPNGLDMHVSLDVYNSDFAIWYKHTSSVTEIPSTEFDLNGEPIQGSLQLTYHIPYETISKNENLGVLDFAINLRVRSSSGIVYPKPYEYSWRNIPSFNYIVGTPENGKIYTTPQDVNDPNLSTYILNNAVTIKFQPYNYTTEVVSVSYKLNNGTPQFFNIRLREWTTQNFILPVELADGPNTLSIESGSFSQTYYIYAKQLDIAFKWHRKNIPSSSIDSYYYRITDSNIVTANTSVLTYATRNTYIKSTAGDTQDYKNITFNPSASFAATDMHVALGIQYSVVNDHNSPIVSFYNASGDAILTISQSKLNIEKIATESIEIFIPKSDNYAWQNKEEYHLIDIYIHKIKDVYDGNGSYAELGNANFYELIVYIDGKSDGAMTTYLATIDKIQNVRIFKGNHFINTIETAYTSNNITLNDIDADLYYYTWRLNTAMAEDPYTVIPENKQNMLASIVNDDLSFSFKHNMLKVSETMMTTISRYSEIPSLVFEVEHIYDQGGGYTIYTLLNGQFKDTEDPKIKWTTTPYWIHPGTTTLTEVNKFPTSRYYIKLQGSSTMAYKSKNFTFGIENETTYQGGETKYVYMFSPNFKSSDSTTFLPETSYTLKADIVDSSHSNNNAVGDFVNAVTTPFITGQTGDYARYVRNCLTGFPVLVYLRVKALDESKTADTYFLGIYNFNLGRDSYSNLGYRDLSKFRDIEDANPFTIYSMAENDANPKENFAVAEISGGDKKFDFSQYDSTILFALDKNEDADANTHMFGDMIYANEISAKTAIGNFMKSVALSGGFLFDAIGKSRPKAHNTWDGYHYIDEIPDYTKQYKRSRSLASGFIYNESDAYTIAPGTSDDLLKCIFDEYQGETNTPYLDYTSAVEYYTICMAFGLVDSVQKNLNIKTWNGKTFNIAFYDMDTCLGIDNSGAKTEVFCFSDYWFGQSIKNENDNSETLQPLTIYRDYWDAESDYKGYDVPSSFLFSIVKYGEPVMYHNNILSGKSIDYPSPKDLWAKYRMNSKMTGNGYLGSAELRNANYFIDNYYKKHLGNIAEIVLNMNYRNKYTYFMMDETYDADAKRYISKPYTGGYSTRDIAKFRGDCIEKTREWLNSRIHILDAYFNINNFDTTLSTDAKTGADTIVETSYNKEYYESQVIANDDVSILRHIFQDVVKQSLKKTTLTVKAKPFSPLIITHAGKMMESDGSLGSGRYILVDENTPYTFTVDLDGNEEIQFLGSTEWTSLNSVSWLTATPAEIKSDYLTQIVGAKTSGQNLTWSNIYAPALQTLSLTGKQYLGTITMDANDVDKFPNINSININNSQISLYINNEPVKTITATNVSGSATLTITNCTNLSSVNLAGSTFSAVNLNTTWGNNILLNNFNCTTLTLSGSGSITIDGSSNKFQSLQSVSLSGYESITIKGCPKLQSVILGNISIIRNIQITNCATDANAVFSVGSAITPGHINLTGMGSTTSVSFTNTRHFTDVILPMGITLTTNTFSGCQEMEYMRTANGTNEPIYLNGTSIFYNTLSFKMKVSASSSAFTNLRVSQNVTSLNNLFYCTSDTSSMSIDAVAYFLSTSTGKTLTTPYVSKVSTIENMFRGRIIKYDKASYTADCTRKISKLDLGAFTNVSNAKNVFYITSSDNLSNHITYANKYVWGYQNNGKGLGKNVSTIDISNIFGGYSCHIPLDFYYPILEKMSYTIFNRGDHVPTIYIIHNDTGSLNGRSPDGVLRIEEHGTCGENITSTQANPTYPFVMFCDGTSITQNQQTGQWEGFVYPKKLVRISGKFYSASNAYICLKYFFSKEWTSFTSIYRFHGGSTSPYVFGYETLLNANSMPQKLREIFDSLCFANTQETAIDYEKFIDFKTYADNVNAASSALFTSSASNIDYPSMLFYKKMTKTTFDEWMNHIVKKKNLTASSYVFFNTTVLCQSQSDNLFQFALKPMNAIEQNASYNTNISGLNEMFNGLRFTYKDNDIPINVSDDLFWCIPNVKYLYKTFRNTYWSHNLPYNFFNKRYEEIDPMAWMYGGGSFPQTEIYRCAYHSFNYRQEIADLRYTFANITFSSDSARYFTPREELENNYVITNDETKNNIGYKYVGTTSFFNNNLCTTTQDIPSNTELTDNENIRGHYTHNLTAQGDFTPSNYAIPSECVNRLFVAPDILYGCTDACTLDGLFSVDNVDSTDTGKHFCGMIPEHMTKNVKNPTNGIPNIFKNLAIIPRYIGTFKAFDVNGDDAGHQSHGEMSEYSDIYLYVPPFFTESTSLSNAFNFLLMTPSGGVATASGQTSMYKKYDSYYVLDSTSIPNGTKTLNNAFPNVSYQYLCNNSGGGYIPSHSYNYDIHYNYMGQFVRDEHDNDLIIEVIDGLDSTKFTDMAIDNLVSWKIASLYYGHLFTSETLLNNLSYTSTDSHSVKIGSGQYGQISCNMILPKMSNSTSITNRFLSVDNGTRSIYISQFGDDDAISLNLYLGTYDSSQKKYIGGQFNNILTATESDGVPLYSPYANLD